MLERLLLKLELRDRLHPDEHSALGESFGGPKWYAAGSEVVRQGSSPGESTLLLEGLTGRSVILKDGSQQITALHIPGDFVDLHSFLIRTMDHSVVALTDCTMAGVPHPKLRDLTSRYPHLGRLLWFSTLLDAAIYLHWLAAMGRRDALSQLAHLLCELYLRMQVVGLASDHAFDLRLNQTQLSDILGRSRATVNNTVQVLRATRFVTWTGTRVHIENWDALTELAEFDPTYLQLQAMPV
jgi:CRP-like cAMP-binding protein